MGYEHETPVLVLTILLISGLVILGGSQEYRAETRLEADRLVISTESTVAKGNVQLTRAEWSLNSDYLELKEIEDTDRLNARGNVVLKSEEFTVRAERLAGKLPEEETDESLELTLIKASGKSNSVSFSGVKIGLAIEEAELVSLTILSNAELSLGEDSSLKGNDIRAMKVESGWDFEATGEPEYESESTTLRAETITGAAFTETEDASQEAIAEGNVRLTRPNWSLNSDYLKLELDGETEELSAEGKVKFSLEEEANLTGGKVAITEIEEGWNFEASQKAQFEGKTTSLRADSITGRILSGTEDEIKLSNVNAEGISGRIELTGTGGEAKNIQVLGESAVLEFDSSSGLSRAEFDSGSFTSCEGCQCDGGCAYSISADRTSLIEGDFVLARFARQKTFGLPVGWSPLYFLTLKDVGIPDRPYFPQIGLSSVNGFSLSGAFPVFLDKNHFGNVLLDYFSRHQGLGLGLDYYSGGDTITGVGEIYGIYRVFGDNYYKLDGAFEVNPADWIRISTDLTIKQGEFRGGSYDQNEWSLSLDGRDYGLNWKALVSRTEKSDDKIGHAVEKLPEFSLSREEALDNFPLKYGLRTSIGYYRENKDDWTAARSGGKGEIGGNFHFKAPQMGQLNLSLEGEAWANPYYMEPGENISTRAWVNLEPGLKLEGPGTLDIRFVHRDRFGETPFDFDAVERRDRLNLSYGSSQGIFDQSLSFHYDFVPDNGFSTVKYGIGFSRDSLDQKFTVNYEISEASLSSIKTESTYSSEEFEFNLSSGYDFNEDSISETTLGLKLSSEGTTGSIQLKSDPFEAWLKKVSGQLDLEFLETWSLSLEGEYDVQGEELSSLSYSLHNTLQNCLKVGITGSKSGFWFDVGLVGF